MNPRILIVEDEDALALLLRYNLEAAGYQVETVARGRQLVARPQTRQLPVIMLTARGEESERVRALATGADDYVVKPFSVPELMARVGALLRRASPERVADVLAFGDIAMDREKKR